MKSAEMFYEEPEKVIKFYYFTIVSKVKYKATNGERLKILAPSQIFKRLPITLAQVKAPNTSENVLNEISQIIYSLY